ncbi:MAG: signal recognition particle-docking protein FtsY [bacterium]
MFFWGNDEEQSEAENNEESEKLFDALENFRRDVKSIWPGTGVSEDEIDDLEAALLQSDVSLDTVDKILEPIRDNPDISQGSEYLRKTIEGLLTQAGDLELQRASAGPTVYFFIGVNGSGKTTSIAKLTHQIPDSSSVLFAAADTFRAAAIEQLQDWATRLDVEVIAHEKGGDPSAVIYDALEAARNRDYDYVMVDTAGRLHTRDDLMEQLEKMYRVAEEQIPGSPHESLLVLDASTGQNGLKQVETFARELPVTGMVLTKMDSTARGGIVLTVVDELGIPVKLVGTGESLDDLVPFQPEVFSRALLGESVPG